MVAKAVMRAWQSSLGGSPSIGRIYRPETAEEVPPSPERWQQPGRDDDLPPLLADDGDEDPEIRVALRNDIVPKRPGGAHLSTLPMGFWSSHLFWKGIVVGAVIVFLVKTAIAVRAPYGIDWYGF